MTLAERRLVPTPDPPCASQLAGRSAYAIRALYHALRGHLVLAGDVRQHAHSAASKTSAIKPMPATCRGRHEKPALGRALQRENDRPKLRGSRDHLHVSAHERAAAHSITSSARASKVGSMVRQSALAIFNVDNQLDWSTVTYGSLDLRMMQKSSI